MEHPVSITKATQIQEKRPLQFIPNAPLGLLTILVPNGSSHLNTYLRVPRLKRVLILYHRPCKPRPLPFQRDIPFRLPLPFHFPSTPLARLGRRWPRLRPLWQYQFQIVSIPPVLLTWILLLFHLRNTVTLSRHHCSIFPLRDHILHHRILFDVPILLRHPPSHQLPILRALHLIDISIRLKLRLNLSLRLLQVHCSDLLPCPVLHNPLFLNHLCHLSWHRHRIEARI